MDYTLLIYPYFNLNQLIAMLNSINVKGKDLRLIKSLYGKQKVTVRGKTEETGNMYRERGQTGL